MRTKSADYPILIHPTPRETLNNCMKNRPPWTKQINCYYRLMDFEVFVIL